MLRCTAMKGILDRQQISRCMSLPDNNWISGVASLRPENRHMMDFGAPGYRL